MSSIIRNHPVLTAFSLSYLIGFTIYGLARGSSEALVYLIAVGLVMAFVARLYGRTGLSRGVLWALSAWGIAHMAGGLIPVGDGVLYNQPLGFDLIRYDRVVHAFGFGAATVAGWQVLRSWVRAPQAISGGLAVVVALTGMGIGALNEVLEFAATRMQADTNVGGYDNTGWDLVANMTGAFAAAIWIRLRGKLDNGGGDPMARLIGDSDDEAGDIDKIVYGS